MKKLTLSIIVVSFNTREILRECLQSIFNHPISSMEVIVVDNGSVDGSAEMVKKEFPQVQVIKNQGNLGFSRAVNQGIARAIGKYILLLNSDIIVKRNSLRQLVEFAQGNKEAGIVGGQLLDPGGKVQGSCFFLPTLKRTVAEWWLRGPKLSEKFAPAGGRPVEVESVIGAVFLIPRATLELIGDLNEQYFLYFEDLDYCRRARQSGLKIYYVPQSKFIHYHGASGKTVPQKTKQWLLESSKIYHGNLKDFLIQLVIRTGQKWRKI